MNFTIGEEIVVDNNYVISMKKINKADIPFRDYFRNLIKGGIFSKWLIKRGQCTKGTEQSVHSTLSILLLGRLGSMHPQEIFEKYLT